jgi:hypothetical protein
MGRADSIDARDQALDPPAPGRVGTGCLLLTERQSVAFALANGKPVSRERIDALKDDDGEQLALFNVKKTHSDDG